ncbi:MAG: NAD(P)-binding domain-containing protein, partial [Paracoccaceae bacterium]|nr:NAD(P)-binding domain-containing protein [Paracoccaceae bacterium]
MEHDVAVIGLGSMGSAIVKALCACDLRVAVWNRSAALAEPLSVLGATPTQTAAEALCAAPATLICLSDQAATAEVLATAGQLDGRTLVQLSTVTSADALAFSDRARALGAQALVGQIICYPDDVASGRGAAVAS